VGFEVGNRERISDAMSYRICFCFYNVHIFIKGNNKLFICLIYTFLGLFDAIACMCMSNHIYCLYNLFADFWIYLMQ
jgi:hypothetical protein